MKCYLIRHAQTQWNFENRIQGHSDPPLSALGCEQAKRTAGYFSGRSIQALYTSHLIRSRQTAETIAQATGLTPTVIPGLSEIHLGAWEGLTPEEVNARYDGAYQVWKTEPSRVRIPGGEAVAAFHERVRATFAQIAADHREGEIVIVSHGGVIASWLADWVGAEYDQLLHRLVLDNGGISGVDCRTAPPCVLWVNAVEHLNHTAPPTAA